MFNASLVALGFIFGDSQTEQGARKSAQRAADSHTGKCRENRSGNQQRTENGNSQHAG